MAKARSSTSLLRAFALQVRVQQVTSLERSRWRALGSASDILLFLSVSSIEETDLANAISNCFKFGKDP
jgi:hypothetical protein